MKPRHVAAGTLALALAACGYNNSSYNNETAYNVGGATYNDTGANYSEKANYSADESNYSANATTNETVDMNAATTNDVSNTTTNY